jgi:hypothetical protein
VRHAAGELPDGFHLLGLAQGVLGVPMLGNVPADGVEDSISRHAGPRYGPVGAVDAANAIFELDDAVAPRQALDGMRQALAVVRVGDLHQGSVEQRLLVQPQQARPGRIDRPPQAVESEHRHEFVRVLPDAVALLRALGHLGLEILVEARESLLRLLLRIDIDGDGQRADHLAGRVAQWNAAHPRPSPLSVCPAMLEIDAVDQLAAQGASPRKLIPAQAAALVVIRDPALVCVGKLGRNHVLGHECAERRIGEQRTAVAIDEVDAHRQVVDQSPEPGALFGEAGLARLQGLLGPLSLGDVAHHALDAPRIAARIEFHPPLSRDPPDLAVHAADPAVEAPIAAGGQRIVEGAVHRDAVLGHDVFQK